MMRDDIDLEEFRKALETRLKVFSVKNFLQGRLQPELNFWLLVLTGF